MAREGGCVVHARKSDGLTTRKMHGRVAVSLTSSFLLTKLFCINEIAFF
jgi:hypothetical protein